MTKLDEKTSVPLVWFIAGMCSVVTIASAGSVFIVTVNYRLARIETRLGIPEFAVTAPSPFTEAYGSPSEGWKPNNPKHQPGEK